MGEKKNIPELRFPEFEGTWRTGVLGEFTTKEMYGVGAKAIDYNGENKYLRITDIDEESRIFAPNPLSSPEGQVSAKYQLQKKDIVFARTGASVGKSYLYNPNDGNLIFAGFLIKVNVLHGSAPFVFYQTLRDNFKNWIRVTSMRSGQPGINLEELKTFSFFTTSLPEQQKIASFLSAVDKKIELLTKKKELLEKYKKGVMQQIFNQDIRFKDENGKDYPDWEEKRLGEVENLIHGDGDWILSSDLVQNGEYKIVQLGNIGFGKFIKKELKTISEDKFIDLKGTPIIKGDLLINRMIDKGLNCCLFLKKGRYITSVDVCWIRENKYINNYFLMSLILFEKNQNKLLSLSSGSGRVRISKKNLFEKFFFLLPIYEEQTQIANFLGDVDEKIALVVSQLECTKQFKKGLLQKMFV